MVREEVRPGRGRPGASPSHHSGDVHHQAGAVVEKNGDPELDAVRVGHNASLVSLPLLFSLLFLPFSNHTEDEGRGMTQGPQHPPEVALQGGTPSRRRRVTRGAAPFRQAQIFESRWCCKSAPKGRRLGDAACDRRCLGLLVNVEGEKDRGRRG